MRVRIAVTTQARDSSAGESVPRAISASTIKMPEPIMEPMTRAVEEKSPRLCTIRGGAAKVGWSKEGWGRGWSRNEVLTDFDVDVFSFLLRSGFAPLRHLI